MALLVSDQAGRIIATNTEASRLFGYSPGELEGMLVAALLPPEYHAPLQQFLATFWANPESVSTSDAPEVRMLRKDGSDFWVQMGLQLVRTDDADYAVGAMLSIDARRRAELALRESEQRFATAFRVSPDVMSISDFETGRYIEVNEAHERAFGFSRDESIGRSPADLGIITSSAVRKEMVELLERDHRIRNFRVEAHTRNGETRIMQLSAEVIEIAGRRCIVRSTHDVTDRERAEQALRESEEKFSKAFRISPYALSITELLSGRIVDVNEGFERALGYTRAEVVGRTTLELGIWLAPALRDEMVALLRDRQRVREREVEFRAKDGRLVVALFSCDLIEVSGARCVLSTFTDISERRRIEQEKAKLELQLRHSQKLEALGTLAGGIAHDFNNILGAIVACRELALLDIDQPDELRNHLNEIGAATRRATDLVRQILAFSRRQHAERRPIQLHHVVGEALRLLRASLPATIEIKSSLATNTPQVLADPSQVHQIVMNLGTNAAHAMRDRAGKLAVRLDSMELTEKDAGLRPGTYVHLAVEDTGTGMDSAVQARIFEPFFTTKGPAEGTGLGLSVVHGIMADHDGAITVKSTLGVGTTFDLYFPAYVGAEGAALLDNASVPRGEGERVLLVDDEALLCEATRGILLKLGYRVTYFTDPLAALAELRRTPSEFELLLTDYTMPRITGIEVIQEARAIRPDLPIVLVSGLRGMWNQDKLRAFNVSEVVEKPVAIGELARSLRRALASIRR